MPSPHIPSIAVRRALAKLGSDLRDARLRRSFPADVVASRAFTTRPTLRRIEAGDPGVGMGIYAAVLQAMGMLDGLGALADPASDKTGQRLSAEALSERARIKRRKARAPDNG
ncbi:helix-turn-helix domain-containing protein [Blastomonas sp. RAC04]|uniref:helix-turn-helix domain-containing protein n=1 Tax=Blastomonas sp. RAC04 TaxID=1842535 RepID=UPI00083CE7AA|nr:helix-turn-helix domain-containing protein [Blastomonas sp. RAC04]